MVSSSGLLKVLVASVDNLPLTSFDTFREHTRI